jgi:MTH538 TIR-like domain (DUF1863)
MDALTTPAASPTSQSECKYWAFISYSHRDERWARWLHEALETYRVPRRFVQRPDTSVRGPSTERIYPVFLDRDELSGGFDLSERIRTALEQSRFLIVICSPHAAKSRHVQQEVDAFESLGRENRVLCLIVDGEPGASSRAESAQQECLPLAVRTRRTPEGTLVACEPMAADARKGKDGRTNAKLKLLAEMLGVNFDDLKQREERRRFRRRLQMAAAFAAAGVGVGAVYLLALDAGMGGPGGTAVRRLADRHHLSVLRRVPAEAAVRLKAQALRDRLSTRLLAARRGDWFFSAFKPEDSPDVGVWTHSQIAFAMLSRPESDAKSMQEIASLLSNPFATDLKIERAGVKYGWLARPGEVSPLSVPALWTAMALAVALDRNAFPAASARAQARGHLAYVEESLAPYQPAGTTGWNLFPHQLQPTQHNVYAAVLALMALLEVKRADLPWQGSVEQRDHLIRQTFDWLVGRFDHDENPPGWTAGDDSLSTSSDGLSIQIYGRLLDAQSEAGLTIPPAIAEAIPRHLAGIAERTIDFPVSSGEFAAMIIADAGKQYLVRESINFPWYPWAVDCAALWLRSEEARNVPVEDRVAVERTLAHLVMTLGDQAVTVASEGWTFVAAETLYGLAAVGPRDASRN